MITNRKAKELLTTEAPVFFGGIEYKKINALIYRKGDRRYGASAELLDYSENSVTIVPIERIELSENHKLEDVSDEDIKIYLKELEKEVGNLSLNTRQRKTEKAQGSLTEVLRLALRLDEAFMRRKRAKEEAETEETIFSEEDSAFGEAEEGESENGKENALRRKDIQTAWRKKLKRKN